MSKERVLEDAMRLMGREELVDGLKVSEEQLDQWLARRAPMPARKLGDLSELLIKYAYKVRGR
jgi:hypothetical protein